MNDQTQAEYRALRDTIRERGTARLCAVLVGLIAWGALAIALLITELEGGVTLVPFVVLAGNLRNQLLHPHGCRTNRPLHSGLLRRTCGRQWMGNNRDELWRDVPVFRARSVVLDCLCRRDDAELFQRAGCGRAPARLDRPFVRRASRLRLQNRLCEKNGRRSTRTRPRSIPQPAIQVIGFAHQNYSRRGRTTTLPLIDVRSTVTLKIVQILRKCSIDLTSSLSLCSSHKVDSQARKLLKRCAGGWYG